MVSRNAFNVLEKFTYVLSRLCYDCKRSLKQSKVKSCQSSDLSSEFAKLDVTQSKIESFVDSLHEHEMLMVEYGRLLEKSRYDMKGSKKSYAAVLKRGYAEVVDKVSTKLNGLPKGGAPASSVATEQVMAGMFSDIMEKDRRKLNLVVYNLPEEPADDVRARTECDNAKFATMIKECLGLDVRVTKSFRAGKKMEEKPRTLVLTLDSLDQKTEVLEKAYRLSHSSKWNSVYIAPDRTPKERVEHKKLREELKRRQVEGENDIVIRRGKIIKKARPGEMSSSAQEESHSREVPDRPRPVTIPAETHDAPSTSQRHAANTGQGASGSSPNQE